MSVAHPSRSRTVSGSSRSISARDSSGLAEGAAAVGGSLMQPDSRGTQPARTATRAPDRWARRTRPIRSTFAILIGRSGRGSRLGNINRSLVCTASQYGHAEVDRSTADLMVAHVSPIRRLSPTRLGIVAAVLFNTPRSRSLDSRAARSDSVFPVSKCARPRSRRLRAR